MMSLTRKRRSRRRETHREGRNQRDRRLYWWRKRTEGDREAGVGLREAGRDLIGLGGVQRVVTTVSGGKGERPFRSLSEERSALPWRSACSR